MTWKLMTFVILVGASFTVISAARCAHRFCDYLLNRQWDLGLSQYYLNIPNFCTHLILRGAEVNSQYQISMSSFQFNDLQVAVTKRNAYGTGSFKLILAVQNVDNFTAFVSMYNRSANRQLFVNNTINSLRDLTLDGIKIDVQPKEGGNKRQFTNLIRDLKQGFLNEAGRTNSTPLLLSVGIPSNKTFLDLYYDLYNISEHADTVELATYSFESLNSEDRRYFRYGEPPHHSPLYSYNETDFKSIDYMCRYVSGLGVLKSKIIVGLSTFISIYDKVNETHHVSSVIFKHNYREICRFGLISTRRTLEPGKGLSIYLGRLLYRSGTLAFYDDHTSLKQRVRYVKENQYGGVLLYDLISDERHNTCNRTYNPTEEIHDFPLFTAVREECSID